LKNIPNVREMDAWDGKQKLSGVREGYVFTEEDRVAGRPPESAFEPISLARILRATLVQVPMKELTLQDTQHGQKCLKAFDAADGTIDLEDADYSWLKPILERELPKTWGFNAPTILEAFCENGQVASRAERRRR
jgi:hypothetical protein